MPLEPGQHLAQYRIDRLLGQGGMGVVYRAEDLKLRRAVALKILPSDRIADPERRARFLREARAAASVTHPNIAVVHEIGDSEGMVFIAMELVEGETLRAAIRAGPIPPAEVLRLGMEVAAGLSAAHRARVVHRDLKPDNIMVVPDGRVKILDFGLAKLLAQPEERATEAESEALTESAIVTRAGSVMGTTAYMSPEQVRGRPADTRSDLFAFGIVMYEMATGQRPFRGATPADLMSAILQHQATPPSAVNAEVPPELERIIGKCLEKEPAERYQHADELVVDLKRLQRQTVSTPFARADDPAPARNPARRRRAAVIAAAAAALLVVIATALWLGFHAGDTGSGRSAATETSPAQALPSTSPAAIVPEARSGVTTIAVLPFNDVSQDENQEYFADGLSDELMNTLAHVRGLRVTGRTSSFAFKGKNEDLREIGRKLGVSAILEGSVRRAGNRVRIVAQLVSTADGFQIWSEDYDGALEDIFAVQEAIAGSVSAALEVMVLEGERERLKPRTSSPEAYDIYLRGLNHFTRGSRADIEEAMRELEKVVGLDPGYAPAWVYLAACHYRAAEFGMVSLQEGYDAAERAARRALALDDHYGIAHAVLGLLEANRNWNWNAASAEFQKALTMDPGSAVILFLASGIELKTGRTEEAIGHARRSVELEPLSADFHAHLASILRLTGNLDEAETSVRRAIGLNPDLAVAHSLLGQVLLAKGDLEAARLEMEREEVPVYRLFGLALVQFALGNRKEADAALTELTRSYEQDWSYQVAQVHAFRGDANRAFEWLDRAYERRDTGLSWAAIDPYLRRLEDDPRYERFLNRMGLPVVTLNAGTR